LYLVVRVRKQFLTVKYIGREIESVSQLDIQEGTAAVMALSPEDVRYLRHWQVSIQCLPRDPDLDFIRCLRIISERIVPQLVPPMNLEEHRKQTKLSEYDEFASRVWTGYLESMINRNNKELVDIFKRVSEEVMLEQGYPNTMRLGLWVHPYKLIANVCRALATGDVGRSFLKKFVFTNEDDGSGRGEPASNGNPGSSQRPREAKLADVIASLASSHSGRTHLRDCVLKGKEELFKWKVGEREMSVILSESGGAPENDRSNYMLIKIHLDSVPESVIAGRRPPEGPPGGQSQ
jgi:hypothetical protein